MSRMPQLSRALRLPRTVQLTLEKVSTLPWKHRPVSHGISVQFAVELMSTLVWKTHHSERVSNRRENHESCH